MDRRIVKTRDAIRNAYIELVIEKGSSHISISELSRRANIDRKTFYPLIIFLLRLPHNIVQMQ